MPERFSKPGEHNSVRGAVSQLRQIWINRDLTSEDFTKAIEDWGKE